MDDREKVIKGLETIKQFFGYGLPSTAEMFDSYYDTLNGAIVLLKEQEIKSMTLEELDEIYEKQDAHIWPFDTPPYLWMTVNPDVRLTDGFWICWRDITYSIENASPFYTRDNYGKAWLIWTGKPTQRQVQAVKWE